jgi:hypothetical protein
LSFACYRLAVDAFVDAFVDEGQRKVLGLLNVACRAA